MANTEASASKASLWDSLTERSSVRSSWTLSKEEVLPENIRKNITTVEVVRGKSGMNAKLNFIDGKSAIYGLDLEVQEIAELGDQLRPLSLRLREYTSPDGEMKILRIYGKIKG